ncbi:hypothetical protein [Lutibacter sp.]|uniref:hypothetical protein n=1 Tax=Lutibacter sp. TaxID=1925666 RepID=UPI002737098F|nr:hypothetical protein [Lutibacter sp.]MDP3312603.1 hypothetical protein [Lutibacter sp.]
MQIHGLIHQFPREIKLLILTFIGVLSIGFYGGISFVNTTTTMHPNEVETHYLGNESDENAEIMKFKKSKNEILTIVHNHILSLSVIFFMLALMLATTSLPLGLKYFLMLEPFLSVLFTFGGIYFLWLGITWMKYLIIFSGILMTFTFVVSTLSICYQLLFIKK